MKTSTALSYITYIAVFALGVIIALILTPLLPSLNIPPNFLDIISAAVTSLAFLLALITYSNWRKQKIQEDTYLTTKSYIATLVNIEGAIIDMYRKFYELIPKPGSIVLSEKYITNQILFESGSQRTTRSSSKIGPCT